MTKDYTFPNRKRVWSFVIMTSSSIIFRPISLDDMGRILPQGSYSALIVK